MPVAFGGEELNLKDIITSVQPHNSPFRLLIEVENAQKIKVAKNADEKLEPNRMLEEKKNISVHIEVIN